MSELQNLELTDPGTVLAIAAHPDDLEYGAAAAVAIWTDAGHPVSYTLVTSGEAGIDGIGPDECASLREAEEVAGAALVGVSDVEFLGHRDGTIEYGLALRRDLAAAIRRHKPDTLLLFNHREGWGFPGSLNSPDHRAVGQAALEAMGDAGNRWIFPELDLEPHSAKRALVTGSPLSTHGLDVTVGLDRAIASLAEHRAYLEGLGDHPMSDPEFLRANAEQTALRLPGAAPGSAALAFEVFGTV
ncbi:MAG TPA: PIG-L deacetylase family protein [Candidatus Nanopelagicales bacterium]|jgi:LmbE family N-acetylglucosaminyl deacetylase|nr:PIG-L deacetylase family protein [Candidatus Nanopelagicales bacterium]